MNTDSSNSLADRSTTSSSRGKSSTDAPNAPIAFDVERVRSDFPLLQRTVHDKPLVYFDNAATSQKPQAVIDAVRNFYLQKCSNVHRGIHQLSQEATDDFESARRKTQRFLNAADANEIIFVRGTTEAINLVAQAYGRPRVRAGDEILISAMEHHSNIVPWQLLCQQTGAHLRVTPIDDHGELLLDEFEKLLSPRTRLVAITHVSNVLGTINPIARIVRLAHSHGVPVLVDGAQAVPHLAIDVQELDCDFYAFSGHKLFGPAGIGALYGKSSLLKEMPPWHGGGEMIREVTFEKTSYKDPPFRFEAGTPNIAGAIGLGAAIDYLHALWGAPHMSAEARSHEGHMVRPTHSPAEGSPAATHEHDLLTHLTDVLSRIPSVRLIGTARQKVPTVSFVLEGVHAHDLGTILDLEGIAIRTGHHCAQPLMQCFDVPATARASLAFYNTHEEIDRLIPAMQTAREIFRC